MLADLRLVAIQTRYQLVAIARNRRARLFGLVFPVVLLVLFNSLFVTGADSVHLNGTKIGGYAYVTGGMIAYAMLFTAFSQVAIVLISQRETGQLKRLRGTPVPVWTYTVATVLRVLVTVVVMAAVLLALGAWGYSVDVSSRGLAEILLYVVLGGVVLASLGIAATTAVGDVDSAGAILPLAAVLLSFVSGIFVSIDDLPGWLQEVSQVFPVYHLVAGLQTALAPGGGALHGRDLAVLCAWGIGGVAIATWRFRWEPQAATA